MAGYDTMTPGMWHAVVTALGPQAAEAWRQRGNIPVQGMPLATPSQPAPASATLPVAQQGLNAVEEPEAEDTGALGAVTGFGTVPLAQEWTDLQKRQTAFDQQRAASNQARFEEGQKLIQQMYGGPSASDRLWALSRALLSPKPYRGFAGTLASVAGAMSGIAEERQAAERKRAEALLGLRQSYEKAGEEAQGDSLQRQLDMLKARQAANKPGPSQWSGATFVPGTGWVPRPDSGARPVPIGTKVVGGQTRTIYSDGSFTVSLPNGKTARYSAEGHLIDG